MQYGRKTKLPFSCLVGAVSNCAVPPVPIYRGGSQLSEFSRIRHSILKILKSCLSRFIGENPDSDGFASRFIGVALNLPIYEIQEKDFGCDTCM